MVRECGAVSVCKVTKLNGHNHRPVQVYIKAKHVIMRWDITADHAIVVGCSVNTSCRNSNIAVYLASHNHTLNKVYKESYYGMGRVDIKMSHQGPTITRSLVTILRYAP